MIRQKTLVRQHQIIKAARDLIATKGMGAVTIDAIADKVGLSEGAIYRHFTGKQQVLRLLIDEIEGDLLHAVAEAQVAGAAPLDNLERILAAQLAYSGSDQTVYFIVIAEAIGLEGIGLGPRVSRMLSRYLESIQRVLIQGVEDSSLPRDLDVEAAAAAFFALIHTSAIWRALDDYTPPPAEWHSRWWRMYIEGLGFSPGPTVSPCRQATARTTKAPGTVTIESSD